MDQPRVFGPRLHTYSHADAIDDGVLADYQLVVPTVTDTDLRTALTDPDAGPTARRTTALHLAILKAMREQNLKHVFVYFQQIADAADFARQFAHTLRTLPDDLRPGWAGQLTCSPSTAPTAPTGAPPSSPASPTPNAACWPTPRSWAKASTCSAVDGIVFADRTASVRRIVQALGRALRKPPTLTTKTASLVVPAYIPPGADPTDLLGTPYEALWLVTAALRHHDQTIAARAPAPRTPTPPATPTPTSPAVSASTTPSTPPRSPAPWTCWCGPPTAPSCPPRAARASRPRSATTPSAATCA